MRRSLRRVCPTIPGASMDCEQFLTQSAELVSALEARGRCFERTSKAAISVSQFEHPLTNDAICRIMDLLHLVGQQPLSLSEARNLFSSSILDTFCSLLSRLQWKQFRTRLDALETEEGGFRLASLALHTTYEMLSAGWEVQSHSNAESQEAQEDFNR